MDTYSQWILLVTVLAVLSVHVVIGEVMLNIRDQNVLVYDERPDCFGRVRSSFDGNNETCVAARFFNGTGSWWQVDLKQEYTITRAEIDAGLASATMYGVSILLSNSPLNINDSTLDVNDVKNCWSHKPKTPHPDGIINAKCEPGARGRYFQIYQKVSRSPLYMCEVTLYSLGTSCYGAATRLDCDKKCHCKKNAACTNEGKCSKGCENRYSGPTCQKYCTKNTYLINGQCTGTCRCERPEECVSATGKCDGVCKIGWEGDTCQKNATQIGGKPEKKPGKQSIVAPIVGGLVGVILVAAAGGGAIWYLRRKSAETTSDAKVEGTSYAPKAKSDPPATPKAQAGEASQQNKKASDKAPDKPKSMPTEPKDTPDKAKDKPDPSEKAKDKPERSEKAKDKPDPPEKAKDKPDPPIKSPVPPEDKPPPAQDKPQPADTNKNDASLTTGNPD